MVSSRKRGRQEMEAVEPPSAEPSLVDRIRDMWEFSNLAQYIFTFGSAVKIDENLDIEDLEMECLKSHSTVLPEIGLALLKFVSSHRGLTPAIFDEYTRRQYVAKAADRNPFGEDEEPAKFSEFDIFTKIRVLQQLSQWTFGNPDRIRNLMPEQRDSDQTIWRIEPFGWDSEDRTYIVLDDNRLYRRTDPPPPPPVAKTKKNSKKSKAGRRASKRRRASTAVESETEAADDSVLEEQEQKPAVEDTFGGMKWECLAVTLDHFNSFLATIEKSKDPNEKALRKRIADEVLPLLEKQEESRKRKAAQKERELQNMEKLASAKRSSRIAGRQEQIRQEEESKEAERKKQAELAMAKKEQEKWMKLEKERESRMMTREQRVKEREARRILHEEELASLSEDSKKLETGVGRLSERHLKAEIERKRRALEEIEEEDDDWIFDCICGAYGKIDDGTHSIACDKCNIWQHSKCVGVTQTAAERDDFHFICQTCKRRAEDAERAKTQPPIKIKIQRPGSSSSPLPPAATSHNTTAIGAPSSMSSPQKQGPPTGIFRPNLGYNVSGVSPQSRPFNLGTSNGQSALNRSQASTSQASANSQPNSSPPQRSPYVLAPPPQTKAYSSVNGSPPQVHESPHKASSPASPKGSGSPMRAPPLHMFSAPSSAPNGHKVQSGGLPSNNHASHAPMQSNRPVSSSSNHALPPTPQPFNGHRSFSNDHRRSSINMSSPLAGAPVLTPMNKPPMPLSINGSPAPNFSPGAQPLSSPIMSALPTLSDPDPGHASALPPASTGLSPTKHSPPTPRPSTATGNLSNLPATPSVPSVLPPVASLSPSPQPQDLTPPVKHSEPDRSFHGVSH
ncbi:PHD-finger domain-containing protein [Phlyctema vagabunda]|uniref:PHD-finger domain-containing protein n=1 Tax=Phlyctema vagabunda TaxID=108571 RepID=A0ABR4PWR8_9HELO